MKKDKDHRSDKIEQDRRNFLKGKPSADAIWIDSLALNNNSIVRKEWLPK